MENYKEADLKSWNMRTPESVGIPSKAIMDFMDELDREGLCMHGFIMMKEGKVFAEGYYAPFHKDFPHRMYSVGKSFTSIAIGLLQEEGKLSIDDGICDYFPDKLPPEGVHPYIRKTTIRDMLCMATPHKFTTYKQMDCEDWVRTFFAVEPVRYPGTSFVYDTSSTHVLSALVERLSGMSLLDYLKSKVLDEIGCSDSIRWLTCPMGICQGGSGLICTMRDLARFAYTCMQGGRFQGKQLIPEDYIKEATAKQIDTCLQPVIEEQQGYGYQFWRCRNNGFVLYGMGGQLAVCLPEHDFLLVTTADNKANPNGVQGIYEALWHQIFPFLVGKESKPLPEDPDRTEKLKEKLSRLTVKPEEGILQTDTASRINGKTYSFSVNPIGLSQCRFEFNREESRGIWFYTNETGDHQISFGLGHMEKQKFPGTDYNCISSAAWVEENKLHLRTYIIDECFDSLNMTITFRDGTITISMKKGIEPFLQRYDGFVSGEYRENKEMESLL